MASAPVLAQVPSAEQIQADLQGPFRTTRANPDLSHRGPLARRVEPLLLQQARYLISTLHPWEKDPKALSLTDCGSNEHNIRPNATTVGGLAVVARTIDGGYPEGFSREICVQKAIAILRFVLPTHGAGGMTCNNDKQWKDQWQSAHWAAAAGRGAWLLWDDLDPDLKWLAARMICDEADRFVGKTPPAKVEVDTKAEENAWNSEVIALAAAMFPNHPHRDQWRETAIQWALSSFVSGSDLQANPTIDGKPLRVRVAGPTIYDDYTLENHNRVHPDYMNTFTLCNYENLVYDWGGMKTPDSVLYNAQNIYGSLKKLAFPDGGWVYPNGQDWRLHRNPDWFNSHVEQAVLFDDPEAARLARISLDVAERMAARDPDGGIYAPGEYFFPSTQHSLFDWTGQAYLLLRAYGDGPEPVSEETLWKNLAGRFVFETGKFAVLRSSTSVSTFSWGRQVMGMVLPLQRDLLLAPYERSLIGVVQVAGVEKESPKVRKTVVLRDNKTLSVCGILDRAEGHVEQRFAVVAFPDGRTLYVDALLPKTTDTQVLKLELGALSVLNDVNWVHHDGTRTLYSRQGEKTFSATGPEDEPPVELSSPWYNLDNALGILCLQTSGRQTYRPTHKPSRGRTEQLFCLNVVSPEARSTMLPTFLGNAAAETVLIFCPAQKHEDTRDAAEKVVCERDAPTLIYRIRLADGKEVRVDLDALNVEWE